MNALKVQRIWSNGEEGSKKRFWSDEADGNKKKKLKIVLKDV
jgi:hypothetical protein